MMKMLTALSLIVGLGAPTAAMAQAMSAPTYLAKAGASDLFERESGKLMSGSGKPAIRDFASMMVRDHAKSTADVKAAARRARLTPGAPKLEPKQARDLGALRAARGADRDRLYVEQQRAAHREALTLQQGYARDGQVAPLKAAAAKIAPVVEHHIMMLDRM